MQILTDPESLGTMTIAAHQGVGTFTGEITHPYGKCEWHLYSNFVICMHEWLYG